MILTLSSDDEEELTKKTQSLEQFAQKLVESQSPVTLSAIRKEPSFSDIQQNNILETPMEEAKGKQVYCLVSIKKEFFNVLGNIPDLLLEVECRTIRIGSYRFVPPEMVIRRNF